ncbi:MAG: ABC transporter permease [Lachnospiraceae bacterium]|jgi:peptide/nickel transport system permease protein|nr:ABC transporter permease [Lachnospiraceae bacterium]
MSENNAGFNGVAGTAAQKRKKEGMWKQAWKRLTQDRLAMIGLVGLILMILVALFAPLLTPYAPEEMDFININAAPMRGHPMGTDALGRDYLSRILYGARFSLGLGISSSLFSSILGVAIGSVAGYFGKRVDNVIMRMCDIFQSIPGMMFTIIISLLLGTGYVVTILALGIGHATHTVRLTRAQVLSVRKAEYLDAARTNNCGAVRIMFRHILPNIMSPMLLEFTMSIARMIQYSAGLSIIGLGVQPPTPEWGAMLSAGRNYIRSYPHLVMFPGVFIFLTSFLINLLGDGLRDALDPKLRK